MSELGTYCKGCAYLGDTYGGKSCDYLYITGRRRPCPVGKGCTVRARKKAKRGSCETPRREKSKTPGRREYKRLDQSRARELYEEGWSDRRIAKTLGVHADTVRRWRKRSALVCQRDRRGDEKGRNDLS